MAFSNTWKEKKTWMHMNAQNADMQPPLRDALEFNPLGICKRLFEILSQEVWFCFLQTLQHTFNDNCIRITPLLQAIQGNSPSFLFFQVFFPPLFYI